MPSGGKSLNTNLERGEQVQALQQQDAGLKPPATAGRPALHLNLSHALIRATWGIER